METLPFVVGNTYSRKDIYQIMKVPIERQGGNWDTGYNRYKDDWFIFANVNTPGRTGHKYENKFVGNDLFWFGKNGSRLTHPSIRSLLDPPGNIFIFVREDNSNPKFTFIGNGKAKTVKDTMPVNVIWSFESIHNEVPKT